MSDIDSAIAKLRQAEEIELHLGTVSDADVAVLARATRCTLPEDYIHFLKTCGFASWLGHAVNGVYDPADERFPQSFNFSAAEATTRARQLHGDDPYPFLNRSVVIGKDDMGGYFLLISTTEKTKNRVVWVNRDETWFYTGTWPSFTAFLEEQLA